jgi:hypothetical protein
MYVVLTKQHSAQKGALWSALLAALGWWPATHHDADCMSKLCGPLLQKVSCSWKQGLGQSELKLRRFLHSQSGADMPAIVHVPKRRLQGREAAAHPSGPSAVQQAAARLTWEQGRKGARGA